MGSLMAGWDSQILDPKLVKYKRNKSLTKEEIEAFWSAKKKTEEEHRKAISSPTSKSSQESTHERSEMKYEGSSSLLAANTKEAFNMDMEQETSLENFIKKHGWWTRSNSAFLNEPPVLEGEDMPKNTYASQFHIAKLATTEPDADTGIRSH